MKLRLYVFYWQSITSCRITILALFYLCMDRSGNFIVSSSMTTSPALTTDGSMIIYSLVSTLNLYSDILGGHIVLEVQ
jgi:hypothetical protein